jgi:hypothetical protein
MNAASEGKKNIGNGFQTKWVGVLSVYILMHKYFLDIWKFKNIFLRRNIKGEFHVDENLLAQFSTLHE